MSAREVLGGSSFSLSQETAGGSIASVWGQGAYASFANEAEGIEADGSVTTGQIGADVLLHRLMLGLSVAHSRGEGDYQGAGLYGKTESEMTGIYPYVGYEFTERVLGWASVGYGTGTLKVKPQRGHAAALDTDVDLTVGAGGVRSEVLAGEEDGRWFLLAVNADVAFMRVTEDETANSPGSSTDSNRVRLGLEGSRWVVLEDDKGGFSSSVELGVSRDDGYTGAGASADVGGALVWEKPAHGLTIDLSARSLVWDEESGTREWGLSGGLRYDLAPSSERGLALSLDSGYGSWLTGSADVLFDGVAASSGRRDGTDGPLAPRLGAEVGYGLPAFDGRFTGAPWARFGLTDTGSQWRLGWRFTPSGRRGSDTPDLRSGIELDPHGGERSIRLRLDARF